MLEAAQNIQDDGTAIFACQDDIHRTLPLKQRMRTEQEGTRSLLAAPDVDRRYLNLGDPGHASPFLRRQHRRVAVSHRECLATPGQGGLGDDPGCKGAVAWRDRPRASSSTVTARPFSTSRIRLITGIGPRGRPLPPMRRMLVDALLATGTGFDSEII
nr:hypothetical protein [Lichenicola cladoniae]